MSFVKRNVALAEEYVIDRAAHFTPYPSKVLASAVYLAIRLVIVAYFLKANKNAMPPPLESRAYQPFHWASHTVVISYLNPFTRYPSKSAVAKDLCTHPKRTVAILTDSSIQEAALFQLD